MLLDAAAEIGLPGAALLSVALLGPWIALLKHRERLKWTPGLASASAGLLVVAVIGLFDYYPWMLSPGRGLQWLLWGFWAAQYTQALQRDISPSSGAYV